MNNAVVPKGSPAGSAGGSLQRFVARVSDESHQERHDARCSETHEPLQPQTDWLLSPRYSSALSPPPAPPADGGEK